MRRCTCGLPVLTGILATLCAPPAFAEDPSCSAMAIEADTPVRTRWPGLVNDVRAALETRDDIDRCARVELRARDASIVVEVVLPDGRSAARPASRREDVIPTLEALLLVPQQSSGPRTHALDPSGSEPAPPTASSAPLSEPPAPVLPEVPPGRPLAAPERDAAAAAPVRRAHLRIELSALAGARIGDGQVAVGLGAFSFLDLSGWLVGFEGRADRYKVLSAATPDGGVLELALLGGRRFRFHDLALDLVGGLALVLQGTTSFESQSTAHGGSDVSGTSSSAVSRLLGCARLSFGALSVLHTFVGIDGELGAPRAGDADDLPYVPRLPVWTLGLALGATVGTP